MSRERMGAAPALELPTKEEQLERELKRIQAERRPEDLLSRRSGYSSGVMMNEQHVENYKKNNHRAAAIAAAEWAVHTNKEKLDEADRRLDQFTTDDFLDARARVQEKLKNLEAGQPGDNDADKTDHAEKMKAIRMSLASIDRHLEGQGFSQQEIRTHQAERQKAKEEAKLPDLTDETTEADDIMQVEDSDLMTDDNASKRDPISEKRPRRPDAWAQSVADEPVPASGERESASEKRPRKPLELLDRGDAANQNAGVADPNERLSDQADALDLRNIVNEEKEDAENRITNAVQHDKDVTYWRGKLSAVNAGNPDNNKQIGELNAKMRKAELLAEERAALVEQKLAQKDVKAAAEEAERTKATIAAHEKTILEERDAIIQARENPEHERRLANLTPKKKEVEDLQAGWAHRSAELLKDPKLSVESRKFIEETARNNEKLVETSVVGTKIEDTKARITKVTAEEIPLHEQNVARLEEELLELQIELHRFESIQKHAEKLKKMAEDRIKSVKVSLALSAFTNVNVEHEEESIELDGSPDNVKKSKSTLFEQKMDNRPKTEEKKPQVAGEKVTPQTLSKFYDQFLGVPKGKRHDAERERVDEKIRKVELLLKQQNALAEEAGVIAEALGIKKEMEERQAAFEAKVAEADAERALQIERTRQAQEKTARRDKLRDDMTKASPAELDAMQKEFAGLNAEIAEDERASNTHEKQVTALEREAGAMSDQKDAAAARYGLASNKWEAIGLTLAALATQLKPLKDVSVELPAASIEEPSRLKGALVKGGKATGRFAAKYGARAGWLGLAGLGAIPVGLYKWAKNIVPTFDKFEKKRDQEGFLGALSWFFFEDGVKKEE